MNRNLMMVILLSAAMGVGCKETKKQKAATTKAPNTVQQPENKPQPPATKIVMAGRSGTSVAVNPKDQVSTTFRLQNTNGSTQWQWGLVSSPSGGALSNLTNQSADFSWRATAPGTYNVTVLARDMAKCQQANLNNAQVCFISNQSSNGIRADARYDITQRFTITVKQPASNGSSYTNGGSNQDDSVGLFQRIGQAGKNIFGWLGSVLGS